LVLQLIASTLRADAASLFRSVGPVHHEEVWGSSSKRKFRLIHFLKGDSKSLCGTDIPKGLERALLMARQIVDGKSPDVPIEAAKIVGTAALLDRYSELLASPLTIRF
jgi:hypothetical protein